MMGVFLFLTLRSMGIFPVIMGDEWTYSMAARHLPFSAAVVPSYLYYWVYRQTNTCGSSFLQCSRIFNCIFFVGATPFIYAMARRVSTPMIAAFVALLSILAPVNTYTTYFMPEAMYFGIFWVLSWFAVSCSEMRPRYYGSIIGLILGCLLLVKVHAMFLGPGLAAFIVFSSSRSKSASWRKNAVATIAYLVAATAVVRFGLGYLLAGKPGLDVIGSFYRNMASSPSNSGTVHHLNGPALFVITGHVIGLAALFSVPLASLFLLDLKAIREPGSADNLTCIKAYTMAIIVPLLVVVAYFTASVAAVHSEALNRLHLRYYSFALPLLFIVAAGEASVRSRKPKLYFSLPLAVLISGAALYAVWSMGGRYAPNLTDSPEIRGLTFDKTVWYSIAPLAVISVLIWSINRLWGARLFLFAFMPLSVLGATYYSSRELRFHLKPNIYEQAGMFARQALPAWDRSRLAILGPSIAEVFKAAFLVDDPNAAAVELPAGAPLSEAKIPERAEWVLIIGDNRILPGRNLEYAMGDYALYGILDPDGIKFSQPLLPGVSRLSGISGPEPVGRWSDGKAAEVDMVSPLPREFKLHIIGNAFGPNVGLPFSVRVGNVEKPFRLPETTANVYLDFITDGKENSIIIEVPKPTSPEELGMSRDSRKLGILLKEITIIPLPGTEGTGDLHNAAAESPDLMKSRK